MPNYALLHVTSRILNPARAPPALFNSKYDKEHLPNILNTHPQITPFVHRYAHASDGRFLALYPLDDARFHDGDALEKLTRDSRFTHVLGEDTMDVAEFVPRGLRRVGGWEGQAGYGMRIAPAVVCNWVDAKYGEGEFKNWCEDRNEALAGEMNPAYMRMTAWMRVHGGSELLVIEEWDCKVEEVGGKGLREDVVERDVWGLIEAQGTFATRL